LAGEPAPTPRATAPQVQQAVDRAIKFVQAESATWLNTRKCAACHHVPLALWALAEAERQGYATDKRFVADTVESLLGSKDKLLSSRIFPNSADPPDPNLQVAEVPSVEDLEKAIPRSRVSPDWPQAPHR
jgi:hypothetical protein